MKNIFCVIFLFFIITVIGGCALSPLDPRPEKPWLQQYYQLPQQQYYAVPPKCFEYYDPSKNPVQGTTFPQNQTRGIQRIPINI